MRKNHNLIAICRITSYSGGLDCRLKRLFLPNDPLSFDGIHRYWIPWCLSKKPLPSNIYLLVVITPSNCTAINFTYPRSVFSEK